MSAKSLKSLKKLGCRKLHKMPGSTLKLSGKVREKSGNFILPNLWEPCNCLLSVVCNRWICQRDQYVLNQEHCGILMSDFSRTVLILNVTVSSKMIQPSMACAQAPEQRIACDVPFC